MRCARMLKEDYLLDVHMFVKGYQMYMADKSGKKKLGYPELYLDEKVGRTNLRRYYLEDISRTHSIISKEFNL